ncbi:hypothetical protein [Roseateles depolymerans]|nr:hypothetical protein [Roseateles depolymerans]
MSQMIRSTALVGEGGHGDDVDATAAGGATARPAPAAVPAASFGAVKPP